jgi:acetyltransferase-like isoleucine patch superfamily enzyme
MKIILNAVFICISCFLMMGCAVLMGDLPTISAGATTCPANTITIQDESMHYYNDTWTAKCQGRTFNCTRQVKGNNTVCTEAIIDNK